MKLGRESREVAGMAVRQSKRNVGRGHWQEEGTVKEICQKKTKLEGDSVCL